MKQSEKKCPEILFVCLLISFIFYLGCSNFDGYCQLWDACDVNWKIFWETAYTAFIHSPQPLQPFYLFSCIFIFYFLKQIHNASSIFCPF
jgi:hypothetical protein